MLSRRTYDILEIQVFFIFHWIIKSFQLAFRQRLEKSLQLLIIVHQLQVFKFSYFFFSSFLGEFVLQTVDRGAHEVSIGRQGLREISSWLEERVLVLIFRLFSFSFALRTGRAWRLLATHLNATLAAYLLASSWTDEMRVGSMLILGRSASVISV